MSEDERRRRTVAAQGFAAIALFYALSATLFGRTDSTVARTASETVMPPGAARPCSRAAMFTPSPYTSPSRCITSPM